MYLVILRWYFSWIQSFLQFYSRPLPKACTVWAAPTLQNVGTWWWNEEVAEAVRNKKIKYGKKLYRDCLLFAIIWQLKDIRNMLNLY